MEGREYRADGALVLDGVRYAAIRHADAAWRVGATTPAWQEALVPLGPEPGAEDMARLAGDGIFPVRDAGSVPPLAVMCGGMGSVWPGMGRELYDNFPAARAAMDHIQAIANWDVLALLDEQDVEKINATRWQIPYLFLVEYAQWAYLTSLGLAPALACGHSLGELIALCCAGVYAPETAWYILDTRAEHVAEVEAHAPSEAAMMAVHAGQDVVDEVLRTWPELYVANYNTPTQTIFGGPRAAVREARSALRKRRIVAMMLNVSLTFHSPAMRVLRSLAVRRLNALEMHAPAMPMLSVVTTKPYPDDQIGIVQHIADLDENSVRWVETVQAMWQRHHIRHFLELGPQEILCGLVRDIQPDALCLACGRKGRETQGMRQVCAQLYALGHLPHNVLTARAANHVATQDRLLPEEGATAPNIPQDVPAWWHEEGSQHVLQLLAAACKRDAANLRPEMDLRYDLALRSITFPQLLREAGEVLQREIAFEDLVSVVTVGDLLATLTGHVAAKDADRSERQWPTPVLRRYLPKAANGSDDRTPLPPDPEGEGLPLRKGDVVAVSAHGLAPELLADMLVSLAPLGLTLALPADVPTGKLSQAGSAYDVWDGNADNLEKVDGLLCLGKEQDATPCRARLDALATALGGKGLRYAACLSLLDAVPAATTEEAAFPVPVRHIDVALGEQPPVLHELADILALEILCGDAPHVLWAHDDALADGAVPANPLVGVPFVERRHSFPHVWPHNQSPRLPAPPAHQCGVNRYALACAFSQADDILLAASPRLPASRVLQTLLEAGRMSQPWLEVAGFSDVHLGDLPDAAPGVAREGHATVEGRPWTMHDKVMTRLVDTRLAVRDISANGRHTANWSPTAKATLLLARQTGHLEAPLVQPQPGSPQEDIPLVASLQSLGIAPEGQLVRTLTPLSGNLYRATVQLPVWGIALQPKTGYGNHLLLVESIFQTTQALLARTTAASDPAWRARTVGFILFGRLDPERGPWQLFLHHSWQDGYRQRFDATVRDADDTVVLQLQHLEYEPFAHW